jgi:hypothetical protein
MATLPPDLLSYDDSFRERLARRLLATIIQESRVHDVLVLRIHETRDALADALAEIMALEPQHKTKRMIADHARRVGRMQAYHRKNPNVAKFKARATIIGKGGRA